MSRNFFGQLLRGQKNSFFRRCPFIVQKPVSSAVGGNGLFRTLPTQQKRAFRTQHQPPQHGSRQSSKNSEEECSIALAVLAAKFEGRCWCVSGDLARDMRARPIYVIKFLRSGNTVCFVLQEVDTEMDQIIAPQARPPDTDHLRTALKLGGRDSHLSGAYTLSSLVVIPGL